MVSFSSGGHLFVSGSDGTGLRQLTNGVPKDNFPRWSPDGRRVVFSSSRGGRNQEVWIINADGSGLDRLTETTGGVWHPSWAPDGTRLVYYDVEAGRAVIVEAGKSWKEQSPQTLPAFVPASRFAVFSWSPDGRRLAGVQYGEARFQGILTYSFSTQRFEKLTEFGRDPVWLADSRRIVFHDWQEKIDLVDSQSTSLKRFCPSPEFSGAGEFPSRR